MRQMTQQNVNQLCNLIIIANEEYYNYSVYEIRNIVDWFNTSWLSPFSGKIANEIQRILNEYFINIDNTFDQLNKKVRLAVIRNNEVPENEKIVYKSFKISFINTNSLSSLSTAFADGAVGLRVSPDDAMKEVDTIENLVEEILTIFKICISKCELLDDKDKSDIQYILIYLKNKAINNLDDLKMIINNNYADSKSPLLDLDLDLSSSSYSLNTHVK